MVDMFKALVLVAGLIGTFGQVSDDNQAGGGADITLSELSLKPKLGQDARVVLGTGSNSYSVGVDPSMTFEIKRENTPVLSIDSQGVTTPYVHSKSISANKFVLDGVPQWKMISLETFDSTDSSVAEAGTSSLTTSTTSRGRGWSTDTVLSCAGQSLLLSTNGKFTKTFKSLPKHTQIRIAGTLHFVDDWQDDTAYMKIDKAYVWTRSLLNMNTKGKINLCGSDRFPESRFAEPFDITIPHDTEEFTLEVGSTLGQTMEAYLGLSVFSVYTRDLPVAAAPAAAAAEAK